MSGMIFVSAIFVPIPVLICTWWLGNEGSADSLAGFGLGHSTISILVFTIIRGLSGGQQTLLNQAHGQQEYRLCYIYTYRMVIICFVVWCLFGVPAIYIEQIFVAAGYTSEVA